MFHKTLPIFYLLCSLFFVSCGNTTSVSEAPVTPENNVDFTTVFSNGHSNFKSPTQQLITSTKQLEALYATINSTRKPGIPLPNINFDTHEAFFFCPGEVSHGVDGLKVAKVYAKNNTLYVQLAPGKNDDSGLVTTVMSQPAVLIAFEQQGLPVVIAAAKNTN
ncbi:hypothetical protein G5B37_01945 [Rasiella rasia]|uniref:Uncharacterized protein n=1 Tax=Rasiella rasia TaxID=2744027 RepID=A0A6G6GIJ3_9FLAO|nr:hypothetical protein [Rasiella rasia]QIE58368.1 hypothetical protein G5B37_01945 [Rasiella rasia]